VLLFFEFLFQILRELLSAWSWECSWDVIIFSWLVNLWLESVYSLLLSKVFFFFGLKLLFCHRITHVIAEKLLSVVLSYGLWDLVYLGLECILLVHLLLFHLSQHFLPFLVSRIEPVEFIIWVADPTHWVTFANDFACQVNFWSKCTLRLWAVLRSSLLPLLLLFLKECVLPFIEVFHVAAEHFRVLTYKFARLWNIWLEHVAGPVLVNCVYWFHWSISAHVIIGHRVQEIPLEAISSVPIKPLLHGEPRDFVGWQKWRMAGVFILSLLDYLFGFGIYSWLESEVFLLLFIL